MIIVNSSSLPSSISAQSTRRSGPQNTLKLPVAPMLPNAIPVPESIDIADDTVVFRSRFCSDKIKVPIKKTKKNININDVTDDTVFAGIALFPTFTATTAFGCSL